MRKFEQTRTSDVHFYITLYSLHVGCSLQTCRRSASSLVNDVRICEMFLVLHHKCYSITFLEIVCSMINNLQSQKCSCVKQMPRSVLIGEFLIVSINIQLHTMNLSINNGPVKPRNFISYHKDFTALGDTGKSIGNDDILI